MPAAATCTSTSSGPGSGTGTSATRRTSTPPNSSYSTARMPGQPRQAPRYARRTAGRRRPSGRSGAQELLLGLVHRGVGGEGGDEGLLRHLDPTDGLHALLALLLLLQQLALAGDVAAVALGEHVLADGADVLARDDAAADGGLDRDLELLPRDELAQLLRHGHAVGIGLVLVHDGGEGVHRLALQQDVDLHQVGHLLPRRLVVEAGVAAGARLQLVEEVEDDL